MTMTAKLNQLQNISGNSKIFHIFMTLNFLCREKREKRKLLKNGRPFALINATEKKLYFRGIPLVKVIVPTGASNLVKRTYATKILARKILLLVVTALLRQSSAF